MRPLGWALIQSDWCPYKKRKLGHRHAQGKGTARSSRLQGQGEKPQEKPRLPTPWSWTSSLQNCEKIKVCCLSCPVCGTWIWQPWQINTKSLQVVLNICRLIDLTTLYRDPVTRSATAETWRLTIKKPNYTHTHTHARTLARTHRHAKLNRLRSLTKSYLFIPNYLRTTFLWTSCWRAQWLWLLYGFPRTGLARDSLQEPSGMPSPLPTIRQQFVEFHLCLNSRCRKVTPISRNLYSYPIPALRGH